MRDKETGPKTMTEDEKLTRRLQKIQNTQRAHTHKLINGASHRDYETTHADARYPRVLPVTHSSARLAFVGLNIKAAQSEIKPCCHCARLIRFFGSVTPPTY